MLSSSSINALLSHLLVPTNAMNALLNVQGSDQMQHRTQHAAGNRRGMRDLDVLRRLRHLIHGT
jgi:hypothetical protein